MKKLVLTVAFILASAGLSRAQVSFGGGGHTGLAFTSFPQPLDQLFGVGFGGGAHGDVNIIPALSVRLSFDFNTFHSDKNRLKETWLVFDANGNRTNDFTVEGANVNIIGVSANVIGKIPTHSSIRPYGVLGFGLQFFSLSDERVVFNGRTIAEQRTPEGTTNFGMNFGAGVEFALGHRTNLFFDAKYNLIFTSGSASSYIPLTVGVSL